jgi:hypothetical protein
MPGGGVAPDGGVAPVAPDLLPGRWVEALSWPTVDASEDRPFEEEAVDEADAPAAELEEPRDEVIDRSCPLEAGWRRAKRVPAAELVVPELLVAELPVVRVPELPAAGAVDGAGAACAAGVADVADVAADPREVRSWPGPVPAAGAVGCSVFAGGRTSVEVALSVCVGF